MLFNQTGAQGGATQGATQTGAAGAEAVTDTTTQTFMVDVMEESKRRPVLVDFWAPWCGPCKTLGPIIEKAVRATKGKVKLVKMNIDEHPAIPGKLGIQSIPTVYAFVNGQPVDGFMGALPEGQVNAFIERLMGGPADAGLDEVLASGEAALAEGDVTAAAEIFAAVLGEEPDNLKALTGLVRAQVQAGALEQAKATLALAPADKQNDPLVAAARAALELAEQAQSLGDLASLAAKVDLDPADHAARFDLALALNAKGRREEALVHLLDIVKRDRSWNEDAARKQIVQLFEAWGPTDPLTVSGRKKLSAILFA
ncbi:thioredoxin [Xanthobacter tagetidis]|jgi:putative thioredoxin|uniref:Thioredoxin n=1 Tax=Xanthobacter tagetidis TaxID=60216 RepID=A0A3L7A8K6_9HYPH|nr:thioredoxin [Xanthobacter tagetidis]MBB6306506.1 putative thioredoxin [Xanthobacter tagetidis]RLP76188.1 thioredoxin [Xanthobacter tagetidis]